jgi:tight adherence protein B
MNNVTMLVVIFLGVLAMMLLVFSAGWQYVETQRKKKVVGMLQTVAGSEMVAETTVLKELTSESGDALSRMLEGLNLTKTLQTQIQQAGMDWTVNKLLFVMLAMALVGGAVGYRFRVLVVAWASMAALALAFGMLPYLNIRRQRNKRLGLFEAQFPEALDFLSRAMRAGHAFSVSLEMLAEESPEPLARELRQVFNEQNLGAPVETALQNLAKRVPLLDVSFFVSTVMLQKETGGNLSEILNKLSYIIRERFKLKGQVKAVSAQGRLTGVILTIMPIVTMCLLVVVAPGYLEGMVKDADGKWIVIGAAGGQLLGYFFIRRIVNIKV